MMNSTAPALAHPGGTAAQLGTLASAFESKLYDRIQTRDPIGAPTQLPLLPHLNPQALVEGAQRWPEEVLPFTVRLVADDHDLNKAVQIRHAAYARHLPTFAETLKSPEREDNEGGTVVLLAESKLDGSPLGTMRIQTNQFKPLCLEQSIELPEWLRGLRLAEATRLGVTDGKGGRLVTTVLFKAFYLYCKQIGVEWMVIAGRSPIDRQYERMLFSDVFPGTSFIPLAHAGNLPHRIMSSNVATAEARWTANKNPLFDFAFRTHHPDIQVNERRRALLPPFNGTTAPIQSASYPM